MDWNNVASILLIVILIKWFVGGIYGAWKMHKTPPLTWGWQTIVMVGPIFWLGWGIGTGLRRFVEWRRNKRTQ